MRVLMTGATGLIGKNAGAHLVEAGHTLNVLARDPARAREQLKFPCEIFGWDSDRDTPPRQAYAGVEGIIHLAGENIAKERWTDARKRRLRDSRVRTAELLAQGLGVQARALKFYITASGVGFYGDRGADTLTEKSAGGSDFLAGLCQEWEAAADRFPAERVMRLRFGVVLSPEAGFLSEVLGMFRRFGASRLGSGNQFLSWIHSDDLIRILLECVNELEMHGTYNVVAPEPLTNAQMTEILAEVYKLRRMPPVPAFALKLLYGELAQALLGSQRALPARLSARGFAFQYKEFGAAVRAIAAR